MPLLFGDDFKYYASALGAVLYQIFPAANFLMCESVVDY